MKNLLTASAVLLTCLGLWTASPHLAIAQEIDFDTSGMEDGFDQSFDTSEFDDMYNDSGEIDPEAAAAAGAAGAAAVVGMLCYMAFWMLFCILIIAGLWKMFSKAGKPGWAAIIPFYNTYVLCEVCGKDIVWFILTLIPCVNIIVMIILMIELAKAFGKGAGFAVGLILIPAIFIPILGFGKSEYQGVPAAAK